MKIINLYGGPGSGKSTTAAGLFYKMKLKNISVELVTEYAKDLVYSDRLHNMLDQQEYIFAKQNHRLHRLRDKVDYVITDSPLLLSNNYVNDDWVCVEPFKQLVYATYSTYDNINIYLHRPDTFQQTGRIHSKEESMKLDDSIWQMLQQYQLITQVFDVNDDTVNNILTSIILKDSNE